MEMDVEKNKIIKTSNELLSLQIMIGEEQENMENFNYLGSMITNDTRCTCEMKYRIAMKKAAFNIIRRFTSKLDRNLRKNLVKCCIWSTAIFRCWNADTLESRSEIPGKF
jgi:hypothetical protein